MKSKKEPLEEQAQCALSYTGCWSRGSAAVIRYVKQSLSKRAKQMKSAKKPFGALA